jgi:hypothetical protein
MATVSRTRNGLQRRVDFPEHVKLK